MNQQNKNFTLKQAFESTTYRLQYSCDKYFDIHIKQANSVFKQWLAKKQITSWAFITPFNPKAKIQSEYLNGQLYKKLKIYLKQNQWVFYPAVHITDNFSSTNTETPWPDEASFFITNISKSEALSIAREFNQHAFVFGEKDGEIIWCY